MGEAKRRKQVDPDYGKSVSLNLELIDYCDSTIDRKSAIVISNYWDDSKKMSLDRVSLDNFPNNRQQIAYNLACQPNILDIGLQRQNEQSWGCLSIMLKEFHIIMGRHNYRATSDLVFSWVSVLGLDEINNSKTNKNRLFVLKIIEYLALRCDLEYQFPVWFSGIQSKDNNFYEDIIFVGDRRNPSKIEVSTQI
jgi:hypothetical protein